MADRYAFDELTKELVARQCRGQGAAARAAGLAAETIVVGLKGTRAAGSPQTPAESVRLITKGMIAGLAVADQDFVEACVALMHRLADAAQRAGVDPQQMLTWAMEGMAEGAVVLRADRASALGDAIDREFMGAGMVFSGLCRKAREGR